MIRPPPAAFTHPELLIGIKTIARFLGITDRQASWLEERGHLPTFKIGRRPCARPESLRAWLKDEEEKAAKTRAGDRARRK